MATKHRPLMGRLAYRFNEVIATDALRLALDDSLLRSAFLTYVGEEASTDLSEIRSFELERVTGDGRIDLEGVDQQGRPRLVVETKFGHTMSVEQMAGYLEYQHVALDNGGAGIPGALVLLVPAGRLGHAREIMAFLRSSADSMEIASVALSWEDCMDALRAAVEDLPSSPVGPAADLAQLAAVCESLGSWTVPLQESDDADYDEHLRVVLEQLKERVPARWRGPRVVRDQDYKEMRYFGVLGTVSVEYSIGLSRRFEDTNPTPLWLRFHRETTGFDQIKKIMRRSRFAEQLTEHRGHLWLPLTVQSILAGPELVEDIQAQVEAILRPLESGIDQA